MESQIETRFRHTNTLDEWVTAEQARKIFKGGVGITRKSLMNRVYTNNLPSGSVRKSVRGNYFFNIRMLMGFECLSQ